MIRHGGSIAQLFVKSEVLTSVSDSAAWWSHCEWKLRQHLTDCYVHNNVAEGMLVVPTSKQILCVDVAEKKEKMLPSADKHNIVDAHLWLKPIHHSLFVILIQYLNTPNMIPAHITSSCLSLHQVVCDTGLPLVETKNRRQWSKSFHKGNCNPNLRFEVFEASEKIVDHLKIRSYWCWTCERK